MTNVKAYLVENCSRESFGSSGSSSASDFDKSDMGLGLAMAGLFGGLALAAYTTGGGSDEKFSAKKWGGKKQPKLGIGKVTVYKSPDGEYAVVPPSRREAEVYYTDDAVDAKNSARAMQSTGLGVFHSEGHTKLTTTRPDLSLKADAARARASEKARRATMLPGGEALGPISEGMDESRREATLDEWYAAASDAEAEYVSRGEIPSWLNPEGRVPWYGSKAASQKSKPSAGSALNLRAREDYLRSAEKRADIRTGFFTKVKDAAEAYGWHDGYDDKSRGAIESPKRHSLLNPAEWRAYKSEYASGYSEGPSYSGRAAALERMTGKAPSARATMLKVHDSDKAYRARQSVNYGEGWSQAMSDHVNSGVSELRRTAPDVGRMLGADAGRAYKRYLSLVDSPGGGRKQDAAEEAKLREFFANRIAKRSKTKRFWDTEGGRMSEYTLARFYANNSGDFSVVDFMKRLDNLKVGKSVDLVGLGVRTTRSK